MSVDERFPSASGTDTWISWNANDLFLGVRHPDVARQSPLYWVVFTLGNGQPGADQASPIGRQAPALPFPGTQQIRVKADSSYYDVLEWNGSVWVQRGQALGAFGGRIAVRDDTQTLEVAVPRALFGLRSWIDVHVHLVFEAPGFESSYAAMPAPSFADGALDPDLDAWL